MASVRLSQRTSKVSSRLALSGVLFDSMNTVAGSQMYDIYRGTYGERAVAIKVPRVFVSDVQVRVSFAYLDPAYRFPRD